MRPAELGDAPAITALSAELGYEGTQAATESRLRLLLPSPDHPVRVAVLEGQVVGWIHTFQALRVESDAFAEIGGLVVGKRWRRLGIGRLLVREAARWATARGLGSLRVRTRLGRPEAPSFYRGLGFVLSKTQEVLVLRSVQDIKTHDAEAAQRAPRPGDEPEEPE